MTACVSSRKPSSGVPCRYHRDLHWRRLHARLDLSTLSISLQVHAGQEQPIMEQVEAHVRSYFEVVMGKKPASAGTSCETIFKDATTDGFDAVVRYMDDHHEGACFYYDNASSSIIFQNFTTAVHESVAPYFSEILPEVREWVASAVPNDRYRLVTAHSERQTLHHRRRNRPVAGQGAQHRFRFHRGSEESREQHGGCI